MKQTRGTVFMLLLRGQGSTGLSGQKVSTISRAP